MKFSKVTIQNVNKKLLTGALALTLITTGLTGCASIENIEYELNEQGYVQQIEGTVDYNFLRCCSFYKVTNNLTKEEYYTIGIKKFNLSYEIFFDIFTMQKISSGDNFDFFMIDNVVEYLNDFGMIKNKYTAEELKEVLNKFIDIQEKENYKQLVKE